MTAPADGIDPDALETCLRVIAQVEALPPEHPDAVAVRRATGSLFKTVKEHRRAERRAAVLAADGALTATTATAAPGRIDDETAGLPLRPAAGGSSAGTLSQPRGCYVCKQRFVELDAFYHQLCPACAARNHARREARTDLRGRRALLTGGRAKIGMYIALRLLRDGAQTTITTRFPRDAARRFAAMADSDRWLHRLRIVGIDLRDPGRVVALADEIAAEGPLDILINNACQTVRRSPAGYALLAAAEAAPLPPGPLPPIRVFGVERGWGSPSGDRTVGPASASGLDRGASATSDRELSPAGANGADLAHWTPTPDALVALALSAGSMPAASCPTSTRPTAGAASWRRSTPSSCSRSSSATRPPRSSSSAGCAPRSRRRARGARTSSTSRRSKGSSSAATRDPATRIRTCPRPR
jgi:hypothetical protein